MDKSDEIFYEGIPANGAAFTKGYSFEVINYKALCRGDQIVICKTLKINKINPRIVLLSKKSLKSEFVPSTHGRALMNGPVSHNSTKYIAEVRVFPIPGDKKGFWKELYDEKEFRLWELTNGGEAYFKRAHSDKMYLWVFKVYELDFNLLSNKDYFSESMSLYRIDEHTTKRIQSSFEDGRIRPVIGNRDFDERIMKLIEIILKWHDQEDDDGQADEGDNDEP